MHGKLQAISLSWLYFGNTMVNFTLPENEFENLTTKMTSNDPDDIDIMMILSTLIASVGIVANFTVVIVFLHDRKLRRKIPNIFIIHQVSRSSIIM